MSEFRDRKWDFGLDPGESFEPLDNEEESFDLAQPHVMTVLGPVDAGALGFTLHHEHLISRPPGADIDPDFVLDDVAAAASELEGYFATGGRAIVDATTAEYGRNAGDLLWIAQRVPVHIVAATGVLDSAEIGPIATAEELAQVMIADLTAGIDETTVKAGLICADGTERVLRAAALAHARTNAPIALGAEGSNDAPRWLSILGHEGVHPSAVQVGIGEGAPDERTLRTILETNALVSFQRWSGVRSGADSRRVQLIAALITAGFDDRILISGNVARKSFWLSHGGGPGFVNFIDLLPLQLIEAGLSAMDVRRIFFENAADSLTIARRRLA